MENNIFSDPELNEDVAICLHKISNNNKSFAALRNARARAFVAKYMADPEWFWAFKEKDRKAASDLSFADWLKTIDVRDYFVGSDLSDKLLEGMSANEVKLVLADEMRLYYDAFRKNAAHSVFERKENADYDGDFREKSESDEELIKLADELLNRHHKEEGADEDEDGDEEENADENNEDEGGDEGNDEDLERVVDAIVKVLDKLSQISESLNKKEGKKENEDKGN